jgi:integrase
MKRALTDRLLRSLAAPCPAPLEVWDQTLRGFGVRVSRRGTVTFFAMRRRRGAGSSQAIRVSIGPYPLLPLAEARQRAREVLRDLYDGIDPREREAERLRAEGAKRSNIFSAVAEEFITRHVSRARTARAIELRIRRELLTRWGNKSISEITRHDVIRAIEEIVDSGRPGAAYQTLTYARRLFGWAIDRDIYGIERAPTDRLSARDLIGAKQPRQRVLTDAELRLIWQATAETYPDGPYIRLLLMLGQRRNELARAIWNEFDLDKALWTLAGARMKSGEPHTVPLPPDAVEILRALPRFAGDVVFSASQGARPLNDFGATKTRLDRRITTLNAGKLIDHWTFHDCRRTFRTGLSTLGIAPHVAELCIGHKQRGIVATYDLHRFDGEKRHAFESWAAQLRSIVEPPPSKVVAFRSKARA